MENNKSLNQNDIESLGWDWSGNPYETYYQIENHKWKLKSNIIVNESGSQEHKIFKDDNLRFQGVISNKEELEKLMIKLDIKNGK